MQVTPLHQTMRSFGSNFVDTQSWMAKFSVKIMQDDLTETPTSCTVNPWSDCHGTDCTFFIINLLTHNVNYSGCTALLTSKVAFYMFIQQIQVLNILNVVYNLSFFFSPKFSLFHNSNIFGSCIIHILYTGCAKIY